MFNLGIRLTNKYVGPYRHKDEWRFIGQAEVISRHEDPSNDKVDMCDSGTDWVLVKVSDVQAKNSPVRKALYDTFTSIGCACGHDCCGCKSEYVTGATKLDGHSDLWLVELQWYLNL